MTIDYRKIIAQAIADMRANGKPFVVYEYSGRWYELVAGRWKSKRVCGAMKKTGDRCRSKELHRGGKCKFHGGLSTRARTPEGKAKAIAAMRAGYAKWRLNQVEQSAQGRYEC